MCLFSTRVISEVSDELNFLDDESLELEIGDCGKVLRSPRNARSLQPEKVILAGQDFDTNSTSLRGLVDPRVGGVAVLVASPPFGIMVDGAIAYMEFNKTNLQAYSVYNRYESARQPVIALVDNYGKLVSAGA